MLAHESKGGHVVRRLQEEIQRVAKTDGAHDVTPVTMALLAGFQFSRAAQVFDQISDQGCVSMQSHATSYPSLRPFP